MIDLNTLSGAVFSEDKKFRFALWRKWNLRHVRGESRPRYVMFVGVNPSKADANQNDLTITKLVHFAKDWGYNGIYMTNLFGMISTDSSFLKDVNDKNANQFIGEANDIYMRSLRSDSDLIVYCWGNWKNIDARSSHVMKEFPGGWCFGKTKSGAPKHPCRLGYKTQIEKF